MRHRISILIIMVLIVGCGGYNTGINHKAEKGFIKFSGNTLDIKVSIDSGPQFTIDVEVDQYELMPGKHSVQVFRNNQLIVDRIIIIDNQTTFELEVQ
jgi:hypothetical protein